MSELNYLQPEWILEIGVSEADEPRPMMMRMLQALLGYKHIASVRKLTRNPDKEQHGSGERNPIHKYELLLQFFSKRNLTALILMRERWEYFYEVLMNESSPRAEFDIKTACASLEDAMSKLRMSALAGESDPNKLAKLLAEIEAAARQQQRNLTKQQVSLTQQQRTVPPVNWRAGQRGLR